MKTVPSSLSVWHDAYTIRSYEVASSGLGTMELVCNLMQESAGRHATALGFGVATMMEQRRIWALSRLTVEVNRYPQIAEQVHATTWPKGVAKLFALRDFFLGDALGHRLASITSSWLILDTETRSLVRPTGTFDGIPIERGKHAIEEPTEKLPDPERPVEIAKIVVRPGDIDVQNHVNSVRYIAWIEGSISQNRPAASFIDRLEVNFVSQSFYGDELSVEIDGESVGADAQGTSNLVRVTRGSDGATVVRARVHVTSQEARQAEESTLDTRGKDVNVATIAAAERILGLRYTEGERVQMLEKVSKLRDGLDSRRKTEIGYDVPTALGFRPLGPPPPPEAGSEQATTVGEHAEAPPLPDSDTDIAYAPVSLLSRWIRSGRITSRKLTELYLRRLQEHGDALSCIVTLTPDLALEQADAADKELAAGRYLGPLHGIPWGAKDLFDTAGIPTTWGANPYRERVPETDAAVVRMLRQAGAVLVAKLSLGALAYGDIWFGGRTNNPWNPTEGSSGSSAGSAAATAAGLVGFAIGSETMGSIVGPSLRCGVAGLRPTFGRVPRTGAMALSWSYDKIGPICRTARDTALVLAAIAGADPGDTDSLDRRFSADDTPSIEGTRVGFSPAWFSGEKAKEAAEFAATLGTIRQACAREKMRLLEIELPDRPYESLHSLISVDAAAAFEELTLSDRDDELVWQEDRAWPNTFRAARFVSAVDYVQLQRLRRIVMDDMLDVFEGVDILVAPEGAGPLLVVTNSTGTPSLTLRAGFRQDGSPFGITLWGAAYAEGLLCDVGVALEGAFAVADRRPSAFA